MKNYFLILFVLFVTLSLTTLSQTSDSLNIPNSDTTYNRIYIKFTKFDKVILSHSPIGLQREFSSKSPNLGNSFDLNLTGMLINFGYNHKSDFGSSAYLGVGLGCLLQVQYGYQFLHKENLIKVRSDFPLILLDIDNKGILNYFSVGMYYVNSNKDISYNNSYGFSVSASTFHVITGLVSTFK